MESQREDICLCSHTWMKSSCPRHRWCANKVNHLIIKVMSVLSYFHVKTKILFTTVLVSVAGQWGVKWYRCLPLLSIPGSHWLLWASQLYTVLYLMARYEFLVVFCVCVGCVCVVLTFFLGSIWQGITKRQPNQPWDSKYSPTCPIVLHL